MNQNPITEDLNLNPINDDDVSKAIMSKNFVEPKSEEELENFNEFLDKDPQLEVPKETDEERIIREAADNERTQRIIREGAERRRLKLLDQPQSLISEHPDLASEELSEAEQTLACRSFYDELRTNNDIIEKKDLNFDCTEVKTVSDSVNQRLKELQIDTSSEQFNNFINNNGEEFKQENFEDPIFQEIFKILASEITNYDLFFNNDNILKYTKIVESGIIINRSEADDWIKNTFIPDLLTVYTTIYQGSFDPQQFNTMFIQILVSLFMDSDFTDILRKIYTEYDIGNKGLDNTDDIMIPKVKEYIDKNSEKLSILFDIPNNKVELKNNILNFGTVNINLNAEDIIITKTKTIILSYNEYIFGIALITNIFNFKKNEKKATIVCRWYMSRNDKKIYKTILTKNLTDKTISLKNKEINKKLLNILDCFQQKTLSKNYMEVQKNKIENVCDNTLNIFFDDLKTNRSIDHLLNSENFSMEIIKYPKLNFDIVIKQGLDAYTKKEFDKYLPYLLEDCSEGLFDRDYVLRYYDNFVNKQDITGEKNIKINEFLYVIGKELLTNNEMLVNGNTIFNDKLVINDPDSESRQKGWEGRSLGYEPLAKKVFPYLFDKCVNIKEYNNNDERYCEKITKTILTLLCLISQPNMGFALTDAIKEQLFNFGEDLIENILISNRALSLPLLGQYPDLEINRNKIAKSLNMSAENIDKLINYNNISIDITKENIIVKRENLYVILLTDPNGVMNLLGVLLVTNIYNIENNTYEATCKMRWSPNNSIIKEFILNNKYNEEYINNSENPERLKKIISYYRCINLNGLTAEEVRNISSGAENNDWKEINLTKTEKIKQKWNKFKERYSEIEEDNPKKMKAAKVIGSVGTAVGLGVAGMAIAGVALSSVLGGKKSKKNMKRRNKKRVTKKYKKLKGTKKTRKGLKKAKKIRNTKKQLRNK